MPNTFYKDLFVLNSCEYIRPTYRSKADEVYTIGIVKFVTRTQYNCILRQGNKISGKKIRSDTRK